MMSALGLSTYLVTVVTVFGLLIGSFLNVVVYRVPAGKSLLPNSACPSCEAPIKPWQNVPVLSWLVLRGRCASCKAPISVRYPIVEAGTAIAFAGVVLWWTADLAGGDGVASWVVLAAFLFLMAVSIALALIDLDTFRLPNVIVLPGICVLGVLLIIAAITSGNYHDLLRALIGGASLTLFYGVLWFFWPGGMGFGDVKLAALLGLALGWIGWGALVVGAFAAFVLGGIFGILLIVSKRGGRKSRIPFGPWMLIGAWVGIFAGEQLSSWYLNEFFAV